jgi:hypothetical protein
LTRRPSEFRPTLFSRTFVLKTAIMVMEGAEFFGHGTDRGNRKIHHVVLGDLQHLGQKTAKGEPPFGAKIYMEVAPLASG